MMSCRNCGKEIHESAPACPQCGGLQHPAGKAGARGAEPGLWMPVTGLVCSILCALALLDEELPDIDLISGIFKLGMIGIVFGIFSICNQVAVRRWQLRSKGLVARRAAVFPVQCSPVLLIYLVHSHEQMIHFHQHLRN